MDALKFAFEILIVGALALPWLAILIQVFSPRPASGGIGNPVNILRFSLAVVPPSTRSAVAGVLILAIGYLLGSSISRIARNFVNDELWGSPEDKIRYNVYLDEYCKHKVLNLVPLPLEKEQQRLAEELCAMNDPKETEKKETEEEKKRKFYMHAQEFFGIQEGAIEYAGTDKVERLKQYYDQIIVLRGAALNWAILFCVSLFGACGTLSARFPGRHFPKVLLLLPTALLFWGIRSFQNHHWNQPDGKMFLEPPLAEFLLVLLGLAGLAVILRAREAKHCLPTCLAAVVLTAVSIGGWWWTEIMYDRQVIHTLPEGTASTAPSAPQK